MSPRTSLWLLLSLTLWIVISGSCRYKIFIWDVKYMEQELEHCFCLWSLHRLHLGQRLNVYPKGVHQDSDYPKLTYFLGYFPVCILNFSEVVELMDLLCSNWLSQYLWHLGAGYLGQSYQIGTTSSTTGILEKNEEERVGVGQEIRHEVLMEQSSIKILEQEKRYFASGIATGILHSF